LGGIPTAQILQNDDEAFLIDCGEGTQLQMTKYKIKKKQDQSHIHFAPARRSLFWFDWFAY
jgi:ribonuclease Z